MNTPHGFKSISNRGKKHHNAGLRRSGTVMQKARLRDERSDQRGRAVNLSDEPY